MVSIYRLIFISLFTIAILAPQSFTLFAYTATELKDFQSSIIDYGWQLNPKFKKVTRKKTKYIIIHTSESNLKSALRTVSIGKKLLNGQKTLGGHANYVIAKNGRTFRILDKKYRVNHAGLSMWDGDIWLNTISIGIELVGHNYAPITNNQYRSLSILIDILQNFYNLDDKVVLTHSQVAYGKPNRWINKNHRGRKYCAKNFVRSKAGLGPSWKYDPDVRAGRLLPDPKLASIFYNSHQAKAAPPAYGTNETVYEISKNVTAWAIAGKKYNSPNTLYILPGGLVISGNRIERRIGWQNLPKGTKVFLY